MKKYKRLQEDNKKLATSGSLEGINKLISEYLYSSNIKLNPVSDTEWEIETKKGVSPYYHVIFKKGKFVFEEK